MANTKSPAVDVAKNSTNGDKTHVVLPTGEHARLIPVTAALIDEVTSRIKDPLPPMWHNPNNERDEPNESDPEYLRELADANRLRGLAALDAMIMFGVELTDGVPEGDEWLKKLRWMEKRGQVDLTLYDLDDQIDREFLYKRLIACPAYLVTQISEISGISEEAVDRQVKSFPGS